MTEVTFRSPTFFDDMQAWPERHVHLVLIATKPDIIKQVPLYRELKKRGHRVLLGHTGQHYSENLSGGMLAEFGVEPDFNLNVRGEMHEIMSQIIGRLGGVVAEMKKRGKTVIPYVHGDTTTAVAGANAAYCNGFSSVHVEAGIRTLTPRYAAFPGGGDWLRTDAGGPVDAAAWHRFLQDKANWERGSQEPYPEQFCTRGAETATGIHLAPVELDAEFLRAEGFSSDRIVTVGNSVVDAVADAVADAQHATVFERYPLLAKGDFVRFCIHRRENCASPVRFAAIAAAMHRLLEEGRTVLLISLFQTEAAFDRFGMRGDIAEWQKAYPHFLYSQVWPEYRDVIAAMTKAAVCATDSGSMQEEMNAMGIPCVTLRFGSDRSESAMCGGNLIAPPVRADVIHGLIGHAWNNEAMRRAPKIYGTGVSAQCIDAVERVLAAGEVFRTEEDRLGVA